MDDDNPQYNDSIMVVSTEKYEFVSWDYYSQLNGQKMSFMFQTINQMIV